ncbi:MAG: heme peroxidase family protein [Actinomycetota bacterium]|nr:heme peroxidase family protein [Actinomycetota bacterium]
MSTEKTKEDMRVDPSPASSARSLTGRAISRRQALGLAGGALAGVAAFASMPKAAGAARVESSSAVLESRADVPPPLTHYDQGKFGRLFPRLPAFASDSPEVRNNLLELGKRGGIMDAGDAPPPANPLTPNPNNPDNPDHTAGITFLGQFLDHDVTFDPTSSLLSQVDPTTVPNFRTPAFELDHVYGAGRRASPHLYDQTSPDGIKLLIDEEAPKDLPRNSQNIAIIGDPRNDENLIVSQLHLAFLKFHNAVVDEVLDGGATNPSAVFDEAQRLVRWHYQWIILNEFLPATVGQELVNDVLKKRRFYKPRGEPFIPVEFSVAAYRFGHSQVRPGYIANFSGDNSQPFLKHIFDINADHDGPDPDDLSGGKRAPRRFVDWQTFFDVGPTPPGHENLGASPKPNKRIDAKLSSPLFELPFGPPNDPQTLAQRNLLRHLTFSLPSGQRVAKEMKFDPLIRNDLSDLQPLGFDRETPLWFYVLKEAELKAEGKTLGPLGGRIIAEVFVGLLQADPNSYLQKDPSWKPTLGQSRDFEMSDLLRFAGVA